MNKARVWFVKTNLLSSQKGNIMDQFALKFGLLCVQYLLYKLHNKPELKECKGWIGCRKGSETYQNSD